MGESKAFDGAEAYFLFNFLHRQHKFRTCALLHLQQNVHDSQCGSGTDIQVYVLPFIKPKLCSQFYFFICVCVCTCILCMSSISTNHINLVTLKSKYN